jgi:hypothetical protein
MHIGSHAETTVSFSAKPEKEKMFNGSIRRFLQEC